MPQEQNAVTGLGGDAEGAKDHGHGENVVKRKGEFDQVTGEELEGFLLAPPARQRAGKKQGQRKPDAGSSPAPRASSPGGSRAMKDAQVQRQQDAE